MATQLATELLNETPRTPGTIEVPAPTAWPFILAFGTALLFAGLVTSMSRHDTNPANNLAVPEEYRHLLVARFDKPTTEPFWALSYIFDFVLRGRAATPMVQ